MTLTLQSVECLRLRQSKLLVKQGSSILQTANKVYNVFITSDSCFVFDNRITQINIYVS